MSRPKFQKKKHWAALDACWENVVVRLEDVVALGEAGGFPASAEVAYLDRGKNRALRGAGWTKDEIAADRIQADLRFIQGLPALGGE